MLTDQIQQNEQLGNTKLNTQEENKNIDNEDQVLTTEEIKEYSKMLLKKFEDKHTHILCITSCNKIDELPVTLYLKRRHHNGKTLKYFIIINLNFETNGLYDYHNDGPRVYNQTINCSKSSEIKNMENCVKILLDLALNLRFDNYQSKFIQATERRFYEIERKAFKTNLDDKECCVCFEPTTSTTACNHPICVKCFHNTRKQSVDDIFKCPMCRKCFGIDFDDDEYDETDNEYQTDDYEDAHLDEDSD